MSVIKPASQILISIVFCSGLVHSMAAMAGVQDRILGIWENIDLSGYIKNETAYRYLEPRSFTKIRNILSLHAEYPLNDLAVVTADGWYYHDHVYDLFDYDTVTARAQRDILQPLNFIENLNEQKDSDVFDIRELYLDLYLDNMDVRVGKQLIVWGIMTGVRIVDEINPMDFRELILPDLLDYRIPLWSVKSDIYFGSSQVQLLWIPDIQFHKPAPSGSEWELLQEVPGTTYPESFTIRNSEFGLKLSGRLWDTELSLSYFYTWDDFPVIFRKVRLLSPEEPVFYPSYTRIHMYGATVQRPVGKVVVKGEFAYVLDKYFGLRTVDNDGDNYLDYEGEWQADHIRWGFGVDFNLWQTEFSPGITQWVIVDYNTDMIQERIDTAFNLFVRKELPQQNAVFQMLVIALLNLNELYLKPKITFNMTDQFQISGGLDLFYGKASQVGLAARDGKAIDLVEIEQRFQFIGNFNNNDRIFAEFKYSF